MLSLRRSSIFVSIAFLVCQTSALGQDAIIAFNATRNSLKLAGAGVSGSIILDGNDWPGVLRAGQDLAGDFGQVTGQKLTQATVNGSTTDINSIGDAGVIIAGTIGKSRLIDSLVSSGKLNVSATKGKWESFQSQLVANPVRGVSRALVIAGSDKRGTIFGLYDISEQIGVSPWHWWADVPATQHSEIFVVNKPKIQGPPSIKYRGLFLNDEQPALTNWVNANYPKGQYGPGYNSDFYARVFELILRLRGNYIWPTTWDSMFYIDDEENKATADRYGIVMGTSHTEPMTRQTKEQSRFLEGHWDWSSNEENVYNFMKEGVLRTKGYETLYTMGMRGNGDEASPTLNAQNLEELVTAQQQMISEVYGNDSVSSIPQMWCLYKEVGGYFQDGLRVPDDVTLLWSDDNWGNAQRLPVGNETDRAGGSGLYYHFDYVGDPRDYKWINTISLQKSWEQLHLAYERQARQIWVVNVGDLKPLEIPINHFFDLAYDTPKWSAPDSTVQWTKAWAERDFGAAYANAISDVVDRYGQYAARRKYELLSSGTYSVINYDEADRVLKEWKQLADDAQVIYDKLSPAAQPAFFQLVLHPCKAGAIVTEIFILAAKNNLYAGQRRTSANAVASRVQTLFTEDHKLTNEYHSLLKGKWNHMMDQTHLGYDYWQQPMRNTLPPLAYTQILETSLAGEMGVSVEGSNGSVSGDNYYNVGLSNNTLVLPPIDPYGPASRWIDIYSRGTGGFEFQVIPQNPWVIATPSSGTVSAAGGGNGSLSDVRVQLSIDWDAAPVGSNVAFVDINTTSQDYGNFEAPSVHLPVNKTAVPSAVSNAFVESDGLVSIEAEHATSNTSTGNVSYGVVPGYGRTFSGVTLLPAVLPETLVPPSSPRLSYDMYLFGGNGVNSTITAKVTVYLGPSLNTDPERPLTYAISLTSSDSGGSPAADVIKTVPFVPVTPLGKLPSTWATVVSDNVWKSTSNHTVTLPQGQGQGSDNSSLGRVGGKFTLNLWALEPGVVFQKIVVDLGGVRSSYLGPPESRRV